MFQPYMYKPYINSLKKLFLIIKLIVCIISVSVNPTSGSYLVPLLIWRNRHEKYKMHAKMESMCVGRKVRVCSRLRRFTTRKECTTRLLYARASVWSAARTGKWSLGAIKQRKSCKLSFLSEWNCLNTIDREKPLPETCLKLETVLYSVTSVSGISCSVVTFNSPVNSTWLHCCHNENS